MKNKITIKNIKNCFVVATITFMAVLTYGTSCGCLALVTKLYISLDATQIILMLYFFSSAAMGALVLIAAIWITIKPMVTRHNWRQLQEGTRPGDVSLQI